MPRWRFGLRWRLALGFAAVLLLALGVVAVATGAIAGREVRHVQQEQDRVRAQRIAVALADFHDANGGWAGVQRFVNRTSFQTERQIIVLDTDGVVVADSRLREEGRRVQDGRGRRNGRRDRDAEDRFFDGSDGTDLPPPEFFAPIVSEDVPVGSVAVMFRGFGSPPFAGGSIGASPSPGAEPPLTRFVEAVRRSLTVAGLIAGAVGVLLVILISRRMLRSIGSLTSAARALGGGDLTHRADVKGNDEIADLGRAFNSMADSLEDSERRRRNMVADVAHELRTPLTNIQGHIEAMQDGLIAPDAESLDAVHRQTLHLNRLVEDLRLLAATESRDFELALEPVTVADIVARVADSFRARAHAGSVDLVVRVPEDLPTLELDRLRTEQALANLMDNAVAHTPRGGTITLSAENVSDSVRVSVADTGAGIPADALRRVFERLYRFDPSHERDTGGSGLGLTIARHLVEAHGGTIWAESAPGSGSRFGFDLPIPQGS